MWKATHRRLGGEQLEKRELLAVYDSFNVSSLGGTVNSARILEAYTDYTVNVSGFVYIQNAQSRLADAEYFEVWDLVNKRKAGAWADSSSISGLDIGVRLSQVNNATKWEPRKADGNYSQTVAGIGQPLQAKFLDAPYTDNSGQFSVRVHTYLPVSVAAYDPVAKEEGRDPGTFRITRGGSARYPLTVSLRLSGTSSDGDADYTSSATTVTFGEWESEVDVTITPIDDRTIETSEAVTLTLDSSEKYDVVPTAASAIVTIEDNDNKPPVAADDSFALLAGTSYAIAVGDLLANDFDPDDAPSPLNVVQATVTNPANGMLMRNAGDGGLVYAPFPGFVGQDTFSYRVTDGLAESNLATVTLDVRPDQTAVEVELNHDVLFQADNDDFVAVVEGTTAVYATSVPFVVTASMATTLSSSSFVKVRVYRTGSDDPLDTFTVSRGQVESRKYPLPIAVGGVLAEEVGLTAIVFDASSGAPLAVAQEDDTITRVDFTLFDQYLAFGKESAAAFGKDQVATSLGRYLNELMSEPDKLSAVAYVMSNERKQDGSEYTFTEAGGIVDTRVGLVAKEITDAVGDGFSTGLEGMLNGARATPSFAVPNKAVDPETLQAIESAFDDARDDGLYRATDGAPLEANSGGVLVAKFTPLSEVAKGVLTPIALSFLKTGEAPTLRDFGNTAKGQVFLESITLAFPLIYGNQSIGNYSVGVTNVSLEGIRDGAVIGQVRIQKGTRFGSTLLTEDLFFEGAVTPTGTLQLNLGIQAKYGPGEETR